MKLKCLFKKRKKEKEYIIPIFVPHYGCPLACTFCNQKRISGQQTDVTAKDVKETIEQYLKNFKDDSKYVEVAFFGGSFTGIDKEIQEELLGAVQEFIEAKKVKSIRLSTRPDYINKDILKMLKRYHVKTIELGVQSSNDYILNRAKRGHTFEDVVKASKLIRKYGFTLGHQMMVGLPESTLHDEINTAKDIIKLKAKIVRIYPVLVIKGTELAREYVQEQYTPLEVDQAVERCKEINYLFRRKNINVIRIGLQNTNEITDPNTKGSDVLAGPYHPAFRQLVEGDMWYDSLAAKIKEVNVKVKKVKISISPESYNNAVGHKKRNIERLKELYDVDIIMNADESLDEDDFRVEVVESY